MRQTFNNLTIAIPVYERYDYFEEAINSVLNQTVTCQIIVVDNHSSHSKFKDYVRSLNLDTVKYYCNVENVGMVENWNKCIEYCNTEWITILHDDDLLSPYFVELISGLIDKHPNYLTYLVAYEFGNQPKAIYEDTRKNTSLLIEINPFRFLLGNITAFPGIVFKKQHGLQQQFINDCYPIADYDFWYRLSEKSPILYIDKIATFYRISEVQTTSTAHKAIIEKTYDYRKNNIGFKNWLFKLFSLFELYQLNLRYMQSYLLKNDKFNFQYKEINQYFLFFNSKMGKKVMPRLYDKFYRYIDSQQKKIAITD